MEVRGRGFWGGWIWLSKLSLLILSHVELVSIELAILVVRIVTGELGKVSLLPPFWAMQVFLLFSWLILKNVRLWVI